MLDSELAQDLALRLNKLMADPHAKKLILDLIETRVNVPLVLAGHPTIQVLELHDGIDYHYQVGFLGLLNGIIGTQGDGEPYLRWKDGQFEADVSFVTE